jgi:Ca2+-binding RTX toxin-like protein
MLRVTGTAALAPGEAGVWLGSGLPPVERLQIAGPAGPVAFRAAADLDIGADWDWNFTIDAATLAALGPIRGSGLGDQIRIALTLEGQGAGGAPRVLEVDGGAGDDRLSVAETASAPAWLVRLIGGAGDDTLIGASTPDELLGGEGNDFLRGGGGGDLLDGGTGTDRMEGGAAADRYRVDSEGDSVIEAPPPPLRQATFQDLEQALEVFGVALSLEQFFGLSSYSPQAMPATGPEDEPLDLEGNGFDGLTLAAFRELWTQVRDGTLPFNEDDQFLQFGLGPPDGRDLVEASVSYRLPNHVEDLTLTGSARDGTGNGLGNVITGNARGNTLDGGAGDDTLIGGAGRDVLDGGPGADRFVYSSPIEFFDLITGFQRGQDKIDIGALLRAVGYAGSDPVGDGYLQLLPVAVPIVGQGLMPVTTLVLFDLDGRGALEAPRLMVQLTGVNLGANDFVTGTGG